MASDRVRVICGPGYGKSASALGYAMMGVFRGKRVIMVQFLKGMLGEGAADVLKRLEPDLKFFRFEHSKERFEDLPEDQKHEELGIVDQGIISKEEFQSFLESRDEETELVMTGRVCPEGIEEYVTDISRVENIDVDNHQE